MKKLINVGILTSFVIFAGWAGCKSDTNIAVTKNPDSPELSKLNTCGNTMSVVFYDEESINTGTVNVMNDVNNIYVTITMNNGWILNKAQLYLGNITRLQVSPLTQNGNPNPELFPYQSSENINLPTYTFVVSRKNADFNNSVAVHGTITKGFQKESAWGAGYNFPRANGATYFSYIIQHCEAINCEESGLKTVTQGEWGMPARGSNNGSYLDKNFLAAFPYGLKVGCNFSVSLNSATDIRNFLPQGGSPASLNRNYFNPNFIINMLAGQLVALKLNIGFDNYDPQFSEGNAHLCDLHIAKGIFKGYTVTQLLVEGENVLGGCPSKYSPEQVNEAIKAVNENYDGRNNGFITCTDPGISHAIEPQK